MGGGWLFSLFGRKRRTTGSEPPGQKKLYIPEALYQRMLNHCKEERPLEACGLFTGEGNQVLSAYATDNAHRSTVIYKVEERQLLQAYRESADKKQEIIAIYHSHVETEPVPSRTDIEQATWPEAFYVIVSLAHSPPRVRAWRIVDKQVTEHKVVVQWGREGAWHDLRQAVRGSADPQ